MLYGKNMLAKIAPILKQKPHVCMQEVIVFSGESGEGTNEELKLPESQLGHLKRSKPTKQPHARRGLHVVSELKKGPTNVPLREEALETRRPFFITRRPNPASFTEKRSKVKVGETAGVPSATRKDGRGIFQGRNFAAATGICYKQPELEYVGGRKFICIIHLLKTVQNEAL